MIKEITAKTILSSYKEADTWFGTKYSMNLYRGCQHACIYCDSRSEVYQLGELSDIRVKENAIDLLRKELRSKREKGTIGFGSMNDCYMPVELKLKYALRALEVIRNFEFPIHIITKSKHVTRDTEIIKEIGKVYSAVSFTITTADDTLAKKLEPATSTTSERFSAMNHLAKNGIYTGLVLMPVLPFINDTYNNIKELCHMAKDNGAQYILAMIGMTCRKGQVEYFYEKLDERFPGVKEKYIAAFGEKYACISPNEPKLYARVKEFCAKHNIDTKMKFYEPSRSGQIDLF